MKKMQFLCYIFIFLAYLLFCKHFDWKILLMHHFSKSFSKSPITTFGTSNLMFIILSSNIFLTFSLFWVNCYLIYLTSCSALSSYFLRSACSCSLLSLKSLNSFSYFSFILPSSSLASNSAPYDMFFLSSSAYYMILWAILSPSKRLLVYWFIFYLLSFF